MADRLSSKINRPGPIARKRDLVVLAGWIQPNDTTDLVASEIACPGISSVVYNAATGQLLVTMDASYADISVQATYQKVAGDTEDRRVDVATVTPGTGSVGTKFILQSSLSSTGAPVAWAASASTKRVHLCIVAALKSAFTNTN